jgi:site-specific recombinase XerD
MDILKQFDAELARQGRATRTRRGYLRDLRGFATWVEQTYGEAFDPAALTREDIRSFRSFLLTVKKQKPATINRKLAALGAFCRWLLARDIVQADPMEGIPRVRQAPTPPKALKRTELRRLIRKAQQAGNHLHIAVVTLLANTGLRSGEASALTLDDVKMTQRKGKIIVHAVSGKGEKYREVPLNAETRRALREYLAARPKIASDRLFIGQRGPLTESGIWRIVTKYARQAGVEASPHVLRHSFATLLVRQKKTDLVAVADLLGHENVETTARYARSTMADRRAAVEGLV